MSAEVAVIVRKCWSCNKPREYRDIKLCRACVQAQSAPPTKAGCPCRICGRDLAPAHPLSDYIGWPPPLLPGYLPTVDEMCEPCQQKLGLSRG